MPCGQWTRQQLASYNSHVKALRDKIWEEAFNADLDKRTLSNRSNLCEATVDKFLSNETKNPNHSTIWKMATAVGLQLEARKLLKIFRPVKKTKRRRKVA